MLNKQITTNHYFQIHITQKPEVKTGCMSNKFYKKCTFIQEHTINIAQLRVDKKTHHFFPFFKLYRRNKIK